jgi:hypothetical protein
VLTLVDFPEPGHKAPDFHALLLHLLRNGSGKLGLMGFLDIRNHFIGDDEDFGIGHAFVLF